MQWFEDSDELAESAKFRDVTSAKRPDLSWARPAEPDASSLRPPRVPSIGGAGDSVLPPAPRTGFASMPPPPHELEGMRGSHDAALPRTPEPEVRRTDTMIDDIVPRAEEEAFVAIRDAVARAETERDKQFEDAEQRLVDLALLVARRVIARELSVDPGIVLGLVKEGISALGERDRLVVRVGTFFRDAREELQAQLSSSKLRCDVVVDPSLGRAGCVVETDLGRVDESVDARLANLIEALSSGSKPAGPR